MNTAILINYNYCVGCHTCEVACQKVKHLDPQTYGIKIHEIGPDEVAQDVWQMDYLPVVTDRCDRCQERLERGKQPLCVQSCFTNCMEIGPVEELARKAETEEKCVLYV